MPTITISRRTKEMLVRLKGRRMWDEFLMELAQNYRRLKAMRALEELRKI